MPSNASSFLRSHGKPSNVGHRGAMGTRPENTLAAFEQAARLGADWVELDVRLSKDGVPMVIHDATLERTTTGRGPVSRASARTLAKLDAGAWFGKAYRGEPVPRLDAVLAWAKERGVGVEIELKGDPVCAPGLAEAVVKAVKDTSTTDRVIVISFDHATCKHLKTITKSLPTGLLYAARPADPVAFAKLAKADVLVPHASFVCPEDVARAHGAGLGVATWAPSDPKVLSALVSAGVDAITVDHPDVLAKVLRAAK